MLRRWPEIAEPPHCRRGCQTEDPQGVEVQDVEEERSLPERAQERSCASSRNTLEEREEQQEQAQRHHHEQRRWRVLLCVEKRHRRTPGRKVLPPRLRIKTGCAKYCKPDQEHKADAGDQRRSIIGTAQDQLSHTVSGSQNSEPGQDPIGDDHPSRVADLERLVRVKE